MEIIQLMIIYLLFFSFFLDQRRMFTLNCVHDGALPHIDSMEENHKLEFYRVLENLPQVMIRSTMMIVYNLLQNIVEKLNLKERGNILVESKCHKCLKGYQRMLTSLGFDSAIEVLVEVFSQLLSCLVCKLGYLLKMKIVKQARY